MTATQYLLTKNVQPQPFVQYTTGGGTAGPQQRSNTSANT